MRHSDRNIILDGLKVLLSVMVIGIHASLLSEVSPPVSDLLVNYVFRIAVPIFFVINGYFLSERLHSASSFWKWFYRIGVLYFFWTLIYLPWIIAKNLDAQTHGVIIGVILDVILGYHHLWYLPALMAAGFALYLAESISASDEIKIACAVGLYFAGATLQYASEYSLFGDTISGLIDHHIVNRNGLFFALPLVFAGVYIRRQNMEQTEAVLLPLVLLGVGLALLFLEFFLRVYLGGSAKSDMLFFIPPLAIGAFLLAIKSHRPTRLRHLSEVATVIYFVHPMILEHGMISRLNSSSFRLMITVVICICIAPALIAINQRLARLVKASVI